MDTILLLIALLAIVIVAMLVLALARCGGGRVSASDEARVQRAYPYEGMIVGFEDHGEGRDGRGEYRMRDFAFEIQPPGESPYQARAAWKVYARSVPALQLGRTVPIKVDLDDPLVIYPDMPGVEYDWARVQATARR